MLAAVQERANFHAVISPLPRAIKYLSRYERGFLAFLDSAPDTASLISSA